MSNTPESAELFLLIEFLGVVLGEVDKEFLDEVDIDTSPELLRDTPGS